MPAAKAATKGSTRSATRPAAFGGWPVQVLDFFEELEVENTKAFWLAHKDLYQAKVLAPMVALLSDLAPEFGEGHVFRPYRDVRFSRDKSPYKTNIAAHNDAGYISLSAGALGVGTGLYMPSADQLARFRTAVAHDRTGIELVGLVEGLRKQGIAVSAHEVLKTAPRGYAADHPRIELLRHKGLTAWKEWPAGRWLDSGGPKKRITDVLRAASPLRRWLDDNVGPAEGR